MSDEKKTFEEKQMKLMSLREEYSEKYDDE